MLDTTKNITKALAAACTCLTGMSVNAETKPWFIDLGAMNYIEQDRNTGVELLINASRELQDEDVFSLIAEFDVVTGATPNGATASNVAQTFTTASGNGTYSVGANELPVDDTHMDTRMSLGMAYEDAMNSDFKINYDARLSMEFDYFSLGAGVEFLYDLNQHNTTLFTGINTEYNRVHPVGGIPDPLVSTPLPNTFQPRGDASVTRRQSGVHFGFNQIINKNSLMQFKYSFSDASGYLNDPYKILSLIDNQNINSLGATVDYLYENRPRQREIQSVYLAYKLNVQGSVVDLSYRYYWDEWDINSNTLDMKYRIKLDQRFFLQPHLRIYGQSSAEFYRHSLNTSEVLPEYASADLRLGEFAAYTVGFRYGKAYSEGRSHTIGVEYYTQRGDSHPDTAVGLQRQQDLYPTLNTLIITWNYSYMW
ncbi:FIG01057804: hypothetical protein [hydrothermal vent metagenome]|uniref:DUF3570 domain-containing protein n=1 Tax=hydrothermal vent metagenome TaxID=652676 RepID=A0A3B0YRM5_9ZZZZ